MGRFIDGKAQVEAMRRRLTQRSISSAQIWSAVGAPLIGLHRYWQMVVLAGMHSNYGTTTDSNWKVPGR